MIIGNPITLGGGGKPKKLLSSLTEGSLISVLEDGKLTPFYVAKHNYEADLNGEGRTLLVRKDLHSRGAWNATGVNTYANSTADNWLNGNYKAMLSAVVQANIGATKIKYTPGNGNSAVSVLDRPVFFLSAHEIGLSAFNVNAEGSLLPIASLLLITQLNGSNESWWTRSPATNTTDKVHYCYYIGTLGTIVATEVSCPYRPCFTLPDTMALNTEPYADGSWGLADEYEPTDTVDITENGIHNVKAFSFANVNVQSEPVLLWTNASPGSAFAEQTVTLPTGYTRYMVEYRLSTSNGATGLTIVDFNTQHMVSGTKGTIIGSGSASIQGRAIQKCYDGGIQFNIGYYVNILTSTAATSQSATVNYNNQYGIPTRIWGVKFTL